MKDKPRVPILGSERTSVFEVENLALDASIASVSACILYCVYLPVISNFFLAFVPLWPVLGVDEAMGVPRGMIVMLSCLEHRYGAQATYALEVHNGMANVKLNVHCRGCAPRE